MTTMQHLQKTARNRRVPERVRASSRAKMTPPVVDPAVLYLWEWCADLLQGLQAGFSSVRASWRDIKAWAELMRHPITPWESHAVLAMSDGYLRAIDPPESVKPSSRKRKDED